MSTDTLDTTPETDTDTVSNAFDALHLFGPKWAGSPVAEECPTVAAPVGQDCFHCGMSIAEGQSGVLAWHITVTEEPVWVAWHRLCFLLIDWSLVAATRRATGPRRLGLTQEDPDPLERIRSAQRRTDLAERELLDAVATARVAGLSWEKIAGVFGVSRQAAWQKWSPHVEQGTPA